MIMLSSAVQFTLRYCLDAIAMPSRLVTSTWFSTSVDSSRAASITRRSSRDALPSIPDLLESVLQELAELKELNSRRVEVEIVEVAALKRANDLKRAEVAELEEANRIERHHVHELIRANKIHVAEVEALVGEIALIKRGNAIISEEVYELREANTKLQLATDAGQDQITELRAIYRLLHQENLDTSSWLHQSPVLAQGSSAQNSSAHDGVDQEIYEVVDCVATPTELTARQQVYSQPRPAAIVSLQGAQASPSPLSTPCAASQQTRSSSVSAIGHWSSSIPTTKPEETSELDEIDCVSCDQNLDVVETASTSSSVVHIPNSFRQSWALKKDGLLGLLKPRNSIRASLRARFQPSSTERAFVERTDIANATDEFPCLHNVRRHSGLGDPFDLWEKVQTGCEEDRYIP